MSDDGLFSKFFIEIEPIFTEQAKKKTEELLKTINKTFSNLQSKNLDKYFKELTKYLKEINKHNDKINKQLKKQKKYIQELNQNIKEQQRYNTLFSIDNFHKLANISSMFITTLGVLSKMKFNTIQDLVDNMHLLREDSKLTYKYLSAAGKVVGTSFSGVSSELNMFAKARRNRIIPPEWGMFGAESSQSMDEMLTLFQQKVNTLPERMGKFFAERMGLPELYRIVRLNNTELKKIISYQLYNKKFVEKMENVAKHIQLLQGQTADLKDNLLINFAPVLVNTIDSINKALRSQEMKNILSSTESLVKDIDDFNRYFKGIPFDALLGIIMWSSKIFRQLAIITGAIMVIQDVVYGVKNFFGGNTDDNRKKTITEILLERTREGKQGLIDAHQAFYNKLFNRNYQAPDLNAIDSFANMLKNNDISNYNNTDIDKKMTQINNININVTPINNSSEISNFVDRIKFEVEQKFSEFKNSSFYKDV